MTNGKVILEIRAVIRQLTKENDTYRSALNHRTAVSTKLSSAIKVILNDERIQQLEMVLTDFKARPLTVIQAECARSVSSLSRSVSENNLSKNIELEAISKNLQLLTTLVKLQEEARLDNASPKKRSRAPKLAKA